MQKPLIIQNVKDTYNFTFSNLPLLLRASIVWVILYTAIVVIFSLSGGEEFMQVMSDFDVALDANPVSAFGEFAVGMSSIGWGTLLISILLFIIYLLAPCAVAVAWHRAYLLAKTPPLFRAGSVEIKYLSVLLILVIGIALFSMIIVLLSMIIVLPVAYGVGYYGITGLDNLAFVPQILMWALVLMLLVRFSLVFPAIAVHNTQMSFMQSFKATKGNSWTIFIGLLLCSLPSIAGFILNENIDAPLIVKMPIIMILDLMTSAFGVFYISICYQTLTATTNEANKSSV